MVVGVDCKRAKWIRWWLEGEQFGGYLGDILWIFSGYFEIFFQYFWDWLVVGVEDLGYFWDWLVVRFDCTRVKWVGWWLGG